MLIELHNVSYAYGYSNCNYQLIMEKNRLMVFGVVFVCELLFIWKHHVFKIPFIWCVSCNAVSISYEILLLYVSRYISICLAVITRTTQKRGPPKLTRPYEHIFSGWYLWWYENDVATLATLCIYACNIVHKICHRTNLICICHVFGMLSSKLGNGDMCFI